jgi:hypothetical protein
MKRTALLLTKCVSPSFAKSGFNMSSFLQPELGVAPSGIKWDIGNFRLWQSTQSNVILFIIRQPVIAINSDNGRYQVAVNIWHQWQQQKDKITGGAVNFTLTTTIPNSTQARQKLEAQWVKELIKQGYMGSANPRFIPLPIQNVTTQVLFDSHLGQVKDNHDTNTFILELTAKGGEEWERGIKTNRLPAGEVQLMYEYPQLLPSVSGRVRFHGQKVYTSLTSALRRSSEGYYYGNKAEIDAAWAKVERDRAIEIELLGNLPLELEATRQNLINTFLEQARQRVSNLLFVPKTDTQPTAEPVYMLQWQSETDVINLTFELRVEGWTWLKDSMNADINTLFQPIDDSYINKIYQETSFPISITVQGDPMISSVAVSLTASEGKSPEALVFTASGGTKEFIGSSRKPEEVLIKYQAKINYTPPKWPVIEINGSATVAQGGDRILLKPGQWVGKLNIYLFIREGNEIKPLANLGKDDAIVVNISYQGAHLRHPIKESARITTQELTQFNFPLDPKGRPSQLKLSAIAVLNGQMLRTPEQTINFNEEDIYILVSKDSIQLVSKNSVIPESDELAQRLLEAGTRLVIVDIP